MKNILLAFLLFSGALNPKVYGQFVTISDANFAAFLQSRYPACMIGNQMDTTCTAITTARTVDCTARNLQSLQGIEYFDNIDTLICSNNLGLTDLENLPSRLKYLKAVGTGVVNITQLPVSLTYLNLDFNYSLISIAALPPNLKIATIQSCRVIESWPAIPSAVTSFSCGGNLNMTNPNLGALPSTLTFLKCFYVNMTALPAFPQGLKTFEVNYTYVTEIPTIPNSVTKATISSCNSLTVLPTIPSSMITLEWNFNTAISSLPVLPSTLRTLVCSGNNYTTLPSLPSGLKRLTCDRNLLTSLPPMPSGLDFLWCNDNLLTSLPPLPNNPSFSTILCQNNNLTSLPTLPSSLSTLWCADNNLTSLPTLPASLNQLNCTNNNITSLPDLPPDMYELIVTNNPLTCLPALTKITTLNFDSTNVTCLPNYGTITNSTPSLSSLPLCTPGGSCPVYYNIAGQTYFDFDTDCVKNNQDTATRSMKVQLWQNGQLLQQAFTGKGGLYSFDAFNTYGDYVTTIDSTYLPFTISCPDTGYYTSTISNTDSIYSDVDFALKCRTGFDIGTEDVLRSIGWFRPGSAHSINLLTGDIAQLYGVSCTSIPGQVKMLMDGPASITSFNGLTPTYTNGDTVVWDITDFSTVNIASSFSFDIVIDSLAQSNDAVCFSIYVSPISGDVNPQNNSYVHCFEVVNSYDPNNKEVYPFSYIDTTQEWLTYTVNFQNTGNAPALNVRIEDTLSNNVDWSSIQLLNYSHDNYTQTFAGGIVKFNFPNINLPDSISDPTGSQGFIRYKVRLKENLPIGTTIENTAYIYFDYNPPIITNTTVNTIALPLPKPATTANNTAACMGDSILLQTAPNPAYTYTWLRNGVSLPNSNFSNWYAVQSGNYKVRVTDGTVSETSEPVAITFNSLPTVSLTFPGTVFCQDAQLVDLSNYASPAGGTFMGQNVTGNSIDVSNVGAYSVAYEYTDNNGCSDSKQAVVQVDACSGIDEKQIIKFAIYPNPNNGEFVLKLDMAISGAVNYTISNMLGVVIERGTLETDGGSDSYLLNLDAAAGVYYFQLQTIFGNYVERVIIE